MDKQYLINDILFVIAYFVMSQLFSRNDLSNIQYDILIYYLSDNDGYKSYIKTSNRIRSLKYQKNKIFFNEKLSMANAMNSLVVDSIIFKTIKNS